MTVYVPLCVCARARVRMCMYGAIQNIANCKQAITKVGWSIITEGLTCQANHLNFEQNDVI